MRSFSPLGTPIEDTCEAEVGRDICSEAGCMGGVSKPPFKSSSNASSALLASGLSIIMGVSSPISVASILEQVQ